MKTYVGKKKDSFGSVHGRPCVKGSVILCRDTLSILMSLSD